MSAYATARLGRSALQVPLDLANGPRPVSQLRDLAGGSSPTDAALDALIGLIAQRIASAVATKLATARPVDPNEWLDSRQAAEYLGVHRDTLRKLAAERAIPAEQDGPGCKLFFRRVDLDEWRRRGGRAAYLSSVLDRAA